MFSLFACVVVVLGVMIPFVYCVGVDHGRNTTTNFDGANDDGAV